MTNCVQIGSRSIYSQLHKSHSVQRCKRRGQKVTSRAISTPSRSLVRSLLTSVLTLSMGSAITDPDETKLISLKVGRATNLNRRMDQWGKQCGSKEQILRGFWPGGMGKEGVPMKGLVQAGPKGPWCHRLERLVHIELADVAMSAPYLEAGYPNIEASKEVDKGDKRDVKKCPDCMYFFPRVVGGLISKTKGSTKHKEIFTFERATKGRYKGKEWESIVKPVIEKWGGFVEGYL